MFFIHLKSPEIEVRATVWNSKGKSRFQIHTNVREGTDGNEGLANLCMTESEKVSKTESFFIAIIAITICTR